MKLLWLTAIPVLALFSVAIVTITTSNSRIPELSAVTYRDKLNGAMKQKLADLQAGANDLQEQRQPYATEMRLKERIRAFPESPGGYADLARFYERTNQPIKELEQWRIVFERLPNSVTSLRQDPVVLVHYGHLNEQVGDLNRAKQAYLLAVHSSHPPLAIQS